MIMTRMPNIVTITPEETILTAGTLLGRHEVDTLPVVDPQEPKSHRQNHEDTADELLYSSRQ